MGRAPSATPAVAAGSGSPPCRCGGAGAAGSGGGEAQRMLSGQRARACTPGHSSGPNTQPDHSKPWLTWFGGVRAGSGDDRAFAVWRGGAEGVAGPGGAAPGRPPPDLSEGGREERPCRSWAALAGGSGRPSKLSSTLWEPAPPLPLSPFTLPLSPHTTHTSTAHTLIKHSYGTPSD